MKTLWWEPALRAKDFFEDRAPYQIVESGWFSGRAASKAGSSLQASQTDWILG
jgi:hypothetical protein